MHSCDQCSELLLDFLYGLLDETEAQSLREHLASCATCRTALAQAEAQQNLIARAAQVYAAVPPFTAPEAQPAETTAPAEAPAATLPLPRPERRRWAWISAAAALLLTALGAYQVHTYQAALTERQTSALQAQRAVEALDKDFVTAEAGYRVALVALPEQVRRGSLYVRLMGPASYQPSAPARYHIATRDPDGKPMPAAVKVRLVDVKNGPLFETNVESRGEQTFTLPAGLPVRPDSLPRLEVEATHPQTALRLPAAPIHVPQPAYATHLALNRSTYRPGEILFFRSLTLDRFNLKLPAQELRLTYVLRAPTGQVVRRLEAQTRHAVAGGEIAVTPNMPAGTYTLEVTAPAKAAQVLPESRHVRIVRGEPPRLQFDRPQYAAGERGIAVFQARRLANGAAVANQPVTVEADVNGKPIPLSGTPPARPVQLRTDKEGKAAISFLVPTMPVNGPATLRLKAQVHDGFANDKVVEGVRVVSQSANALPVTVQFFPEGGDLVAGLPARVYFQARDSQGQPVAIAGTIVDRQGHEIVRIQTADGKPRPAQGCGAFRFTPAAGEHYVLKLTSTRGADQPLPAVQAEGVVLTVPESSGREGVPLRVVVHATSPDRDLFVLATCRGRLVDQQEVSAQRTGTTVELRPVVGTRGVVRVTVCERRAGVLVPLAERLVYRTPAEYLTLSVAGKNGNRSLRYPPGAAVDLEAEVKTEAGRPAALAWLLAAAVDEHTLLEAGDKAAQGPAAQFYLTRAVRHPQELEDAEVLLADTPQARQALDLFLATHGWRRFIPAEQAADAGHAARSNKAAADLPAMLLLDNGQAAVKERYALALAARQKTLHEQAERTWSQLRAERQRRLDEARSAALELGRYEGLPREWFRQAVIGVLLVLFAVGGLFLIVGLVRIARGAHSPASSFALACGAMVLCVVTYLLTADLRTPDEPSGKSATIAQLARKDWAAPEIPPGARVDLQAGRQTKALEQADRPLRDSRLALLDEATKGDDRKTLQPHQLMRVAKGERRTPGPEVSGATSAIANFGAKDNKEKTTAKRGGDPPAWTTDQAKTQLVQPMVKAIAPEPGGKGLAPPPTALPGRGGLGQPKSDRTTGEPKKARSPVMLRAFAYSHAHGSAEAQDTVLWNPLLEATGGIAHVHFELPGNATTYRLLLYGHDAAGRLGTFQGKVQAGK